LALDMDTMFVSRRVIEMADDDEVFIARDGMPYIKLLDMFGFKIMRQKYNRKSFDRCKRKGD